MFPVLNFASPIPGITWRSELGVDGVLSLDVCPSCSHSLNNYYVTIEAAGRKAAGGFMDEGGPVWELDLPFGSRRVDLQPISVSFWDDLDAQEEYLSRRLLEGVYHQVGGRAVKTCRDPIDECQRCGGRVDFFAVIDYDDLNVPLYEEAQPRSLIIGDMRSLNVYLCRQCPTINYGISED
ncbi:hypothetical protein [Steroidobacter cummioxidans]|uniref:hypothetical protein n=1 Tax=Steroidobacter cummioxidans TaxID=1803913 RepID=UPI000E324399|nr:hypothetical protein [Steroidobacter cummioxidans]